MFGVFDGALDRLFDRGGCKEGLQRTVDCQMGLDDHPSDRLAGVFGQEYWILGHHSALAQRFQDSDQIADGHSFSKEILEDLLHG